MNKVLSINRYTGIDARSSIGNPDHPLVNQPNPPSIGELHEVYLSDGVPLAITAAQKALKESRLDLSEITHVVSTTCTDSANPGFDHYVIKGLGISHQVERVLLHGVGCSGGLAALRTAANLALGHAARGRPARILCVALEISTIMVRSELQSIHENQETRIGVALFSDCASAVVLSNGVGTQCEPVYELLGWEHKVIPDTEDDLGFDVDPLGKCWCRERAKRAVSLSRNYKMLTVPTGWKVVLTPRVPKLTGAIIPPTFADLLAALPALPPDYRDAPDFDWAMHPGGATILTGAERAMGISPEHMRASYDTYTRHGNSSSATIFSVMDRLRSGEMDEVAPGGRAREYVVGCAFGPGITVEMCMLRRNMRGRAAVGMGTSGLLTPPGTESEAGRSEGERSEIEDGENGEARVEREADGGHDAFVREALDSLELD